MASEYTPNRRYPLYTDQDKPNLRDQYNQAIREIDGDMKDALDDSSAVATALGAGFDAQHTVKMAIDDANAAITNEATARQTADTQLATDISSEATERQTADTQLATDISSEATARQTADTQLATDISSEATTRQTADTQLATDISSEATARQNADTQLATDISSEATARQTADTVLGQRIDVVERNIIARASFQGSNIMCVNDSWGSDNAGYGVTTNWMKKVCQCLRANYIDLHQGSTGYIAAPSYLTRLQAWVENPSNNPNSINYIFMMGGLNDLANATENIATAIINTINYCLEHFPNAIIFLMPQAMGANAARCSFASNEYNAWRKAALATYNAYINNRGITSRVVFDDSTLYCLTGRLGCMNADWIHPNQDGHNVLASTFINSILGHNTIASQLFTSNGSIAKVTAGDSTREIAFQNGVSFIHDNIFTYRGTVDLAAGAAHDGYLSFWIPYYVPLNTEPYNQADNIMGMAYTFDGTKGMTPIHGGMIRSDITYGPTDQNWQPVARLSVARTFANSVPLTARSGFYMQIDQQSVYI